MICTNCQSQSSKVLESRQQYRYQRRRRECVNCGNRFTTIEVPYDDFLGLKHTEKRFGELRSLLEDEL